jgi:eukaryotic-like serine/threonine-protein kinase
MGQVWRAVHRPTGHPAAVKLLLDPHQSDNVRSFEAEIAAFAALEHPHIVRILDQGRSEEVLHGIPAGAPWLAMELLGGGTAQTIGRDGLQWTALRTVLVQVLDGLAHAHARGLVHRDVKPANILLDDGPYPRWKLGDFGLAQSRGRSVLQAATVAYASPEQLARRDQGPASDLFSLGAVAWRLSTAQASRGGCEPFFRSHQGVGSLWPPTPRRR